MLWLCHNLGLLIMLEEILTSLDRLIVAVYCQVICIIPEHAMYYGIHDIHDEIVQPVASMAF